MQNNHITGELVLFNECIQCSKWTTKERISIYYWILLIFSSDSEEHRKWMSVYLLLGPRTLPWFLWGPVRSVWCRCWGTPPTSARSWRREPRPVSGRFSHTFFSPCHRKERGELLETYSGDLPYLYMHMNTSCNIHLYIPTSNNCIFVNLSILLNFFFLFTIDVPLNKKLKAV